MCEELKIEYILHNFKNLFFIQRCHGDCFIFTMESNYLQITEFNIYITVVILL